MAVKRTKKKIIFCKPEEGYHCGPFQEFTEVCLACGKNCYDYTPLEKAMPEPVTQELADLMTDIVLADATIREKRAGHNGEMGDNGAEELRKMVTAYRAGWTGQVPQGWKSYYDEAVAKLKLKDKQQDPEYQKYLELKQRFEG